jgi:hypothetical protein
MTRARDMFLEQQEQDFNDRMNDLHDEEYYIAPIDINSLKPSQATTEQIANSIIDAVREGRISPIEFAVKKKCILDAFELAFKNEEIKKMVVSEVEQYGKEGASLHGATVKITSTSKYDYSKDPKWAAIKDDMKEMEAALKAQEEKIKIACKNNASLVDSETGEMIASIVPCPKTDTVAVSFKK